MRVRDFLGGCYFLDDTGRKSAGRTGRAANSLAPATFPRPLHPPKVSFKLCNPHAHRLGGAGGCFR